MTDRNKPMTINILRSGTGPRQVMATAPDFATAKQTAQTMFDIVHIDDDADFHDCADFITSSGEVFAIQPEGFTI
jgi:hypothetical protein